MRHEELGVCSLEGICHFLYVVRRASSRNLAADPQSAKHGDRIPDGVLTEERNRLAFFEAISLDERGGEVGGDISDLSPVEVLFGDGVGVAS